MTPDQERLPSVGRPGVIEAIIFLAETCIRPVQLLFRSMLRGRPGTASNFLFNAHLFLNSSITGRFGGHAAAVDVRPAYVAKAVISFHWCAARDGVNADFVRPYGKTVDDCKSV